MDQSRSQHESQLSVAERADELTHLCERFDQEWSSGDAASIESWLEMAPPEKRGLLLSRLLGIELAHRTLLGETPHPGEYAGRFPEYREFVESQFRWLMTATHVDSHAGTKSSTAIFGKIAHAINPETRREPGHVVGRYQLQELVGCGGFGEVWRAYDPQLSRTVAVKLLRPDRKFPDDMFENLRAEARRVASLTHRNIVPVYDIAEDDGGVYIVSEFIPGKTLTDRMLRARPTIAESVAIAVQVADALHHAHLAGFIHRDVKPSNILLRDNGEAVLADFGLATSEADQLHEDGGAMGTWKYMSPEQARGESNRCDARTDVYSLGVVLFELLTGRLPYVGDEPPAYIEQILTREPRLPRTINDAIPPELERLCMCCLAKSPLERFTTCAELAESLRRYQATHSIPGANSSTQPVSASTPQVAQVMSIPRRRHTSAVIAAGLLGAAALVAAVLPAREGPVAATNPHARPPKIPAAPRDGGVNDNIIAAVAAVGDEAGAKLRSPVDTTWQPQLDVEPTIVSWKRGEGREEPFFDAATRTYRVRSDVTEWIATTGTKDSLNFEMRAGVELEDWNGMAALVWCFQEDEAAFPEKQWKCLTVELARWNPSDPFRLTIRRHAVDILAFDDWQISSSATIDEIDVEPPTTTPVPLEITIRDNSLVVRYDGQEWNPKDLLNETLGTTWSKGSIGLMGSGRQVTITDFAIRNLD